RSDSDSQDPISDYLGMRESIRHEHELRRLLYVATTRARSELHLVASVEVTADGVVKDPARSSLLARLWPALTVPAVPVPTHEALATADTSVAVEAQQDKASMLVRPLLTDRTDIVVPPKQ